MKEDHGLTRLYKNGDLKDFFQEDVEAAEKDGWKDTPQSVTQAASSGTTTLEKKPVESKR